jgi:2-polyprenyl-3-methyl-5-hydroxy-6-metoxy-1,4-benzoquinol methylase
MSQAQGPAAIMQLLQAHQVAGVLSAAIELQVFSRLDGGAATAAEVAKGIACPARSTELLLDALVAIDLLAKEGGRYRLSPLAAELLVPGKPMYLGDAAGIMCHQQLWTGMSRLADAVRNDGTILNEHAETPQYRFWEVFARCSASFAHPSAMAIDRALDGWLSKKSKVRVLDVAAGSGIYGFTLAKRPNVELVSLDWPNVIVEMRKWAERLQVDGKRWRTLEGNLFEVEWGGPYDLIVMSHIYHHFDEPTCQGLTDKVARALAPGGRAVIHDFMSDPAVANKGAALFSMIMLVSTRKGRAYSVADYRAWAEKAKLRPLDHVPVEGMPSSVVFAERP